MNNKTRQFKLLRYQKCVSQSTKNCFDSSNNIQVHLGWFGFKLDHLHCFGF